MGGKKEKEAHRTKGNTKVRKKARGKKKNDLLLVMTQQIKLLFKAINLSSPFLLHIFINELRFFWL